MTIQGFTHGLLPLACMAALMAGGCEPSGRGPAPSTLSFAADIQPLLQAHCLDCHSEGKPGHLASGLRLDNYEGLLRGTRHGAVIVPGSSASSTLMRAVSGQTHPAIRMPQGAVPLDAGSQAILRRWIDAGAKE